MWREGEWGVRFWGLRERSPIYSVKVELPNGDLWRRLDPPSTRAILLDGPGWARVSTSHLGSLISTTVSLPSWPWSSVLWGEEGLWWERITIGSICGVLVTPPGG